jgi:ABC-2 type transport system permease protein
LRSLETAIPRRAPLAPLLRKELWEAVGGRALWTMLLLVCPLIGYSYFQAVALYGEASVAGQQSPVLATSLSPLDGILVPTFGAAYVAVTLLFPFVAIRVLGREKETGALRLLVQLPYRASTLIAAKLGAVLAAWLLVSVPVLSSLVIWKLSGGHLSAGETSNLVAGHLCFTACWLVLLGYLPHGFRRAPQRQQFLRSPSPSAHGSWISPALGSLASSNGSLGYP